MMSDEKSSPSRPRSSPDLKDHRVLVVDDNDFNQEMLVEQLERLGLKVDAASHGGEALEKFNATRYSLILTDCRMPVMDGYEFTRRVRSEERNRSIPPTPILAITGAGDDECREAGMNDILPKPMRLKDLREALLSWLPL